MADTLPFDGVYGVGEAESMSLDKCEFQGSMKDAFLFQKDTNSGKTTLKTQRCLRFGRLIQPKPFVGLFCRKC